MKKKPAPKPEPSLVSSLDSVNAKFKRFKELRAKIASIHDLYSECDALFKELLPLFIINEKDSFLITREITVGTEKHRFTPSFYDTEKGIIKTKSWKSAPFETGTIE